ncbi:MAG TPA: trehalose-phosphatase, partial [Candidatus Limnocylindria bacterium]|nr:trehalose-phosphatase [Candidatus Limnocylindria bacterium]
MGPSATALARSALEAAPAGLLTDFDGTLSPIMREPDAARPVAGAVEALEALAARLAVVGVVSGRAAADARRLMGTDRLLVIGNHGLEWLEPGAARAETGVGEGVRRAVALAVEAVPSEQGVEVERKGLSATVHVRKSLEPDAARERVRAALEAAAIPGIVLRPGRMSLELRPSAAGDKGTAVREVVARYGLRGLLVLGDDVTDLDMFRAADELRQAGRLRAAIIGVGAAGEAPPEVE